MSDRSNFGCLLAFVNDARDGGPVLECDPCFEVELEQYSRDIGDHNFPMPPNRGLMVFEGWVEIGYGNDPDVDFRGEWRQLSHWEMCRLRHGQCAWRDAAPSAENSPAEREE